MWTATFTPNDNFDGSATITVDNDSYTDAAGNPAVIRMRSSLIRLIQHWLSRLLKAH
ncbi:Ig-like domain-containing protein [Moritella marina]|uniref:Ig-like domain-containing protein n=1 Tax=Moritella marina TaxID=90736 RepID=UPI003CC811C0